MALGPSRGGGLVNKPLKGGTLGPCTDKNINLRILQLEAVPLFASV